MIGVLMLDTRFERIPGDIGNPASFPGLPLRYQVVPGASPRRVVREADPTLLQPYIHAARDLVSAGARLITTSCGFLALFQRELAAAVPVPVITSSLLQLGAVHAMLPPGRRAGVLTADAQSLTPRHFAAVGAAHVDPVVAGLQDAPEFSRVFLENQSGLNVLRVKQEVVAAAARMRAEHPEVGALVLECTNLPPYADDIRQVTGWPVFHINMLVTHAYAALDHGSAPATGAPA